MSHIVITGGSRGIGAAMVRLLARDGHKVTFLYKSSIEKAHSLVRVLQAEGADVIGIQCDIRQGTKVQEVFRHLFDQRGDVDVLINCAGISWNGLLQDMLDAEWQDIFEANVHGTFYCTKAVLPSMIARKSGVILNVSSIWGAHPASCEVAYSASKGAIDAFTRSLAEEVAYSGIRVNAIAPGVVYTDMAAELGDDVLDYLNKDVPMGRFATPDEIANVAKFLISDAAAYMTGQVITLAGGFVI